MHTDMHEMQAGCLQLLSAPRRAAPAAGGTTTAPAHAPPRLQRVLQAKGAGLQGLQGLHIAAQAGKAARGGGAGLALPLELEPRIQPLIRV